jgi:hypothetical protein
MLITLFFQAITIVISFYQFNLAIIAVNHQFLFLRLCFRKIFINIIHLIDLYYYFVQVLFKTASLSLIDFHFNSVYL